MRVRGLKLKRTMRDNGGAWVAPHAGAWIETDTSDLPVIRNFVPPKFRKVKQPENGKVKQPTKYTIT